MLTPEQVGLDGRRGDPRGRDAPRRTPRSPRRSCAWTAVPTERSPGEELALINAGAAIYVAGAADTIAEGVEAAREALADGRAAEALSRYVAASHRLAPAESSR